VSFSPTIKWLIAIFLPLTLAWKLSVKADGNDHVEEDVIAFLTSQGFKAAKDTNDSRIISVDGSCRMHVMVVLNNGADRDMMRSLVGADENLIFVHQGRIYQEQPILSAILTELSVRVLRKIGLTDRREFVLAVVTQRQCDVHRLPWDQLQ
jgi:hypothetical protein